MADFVILVASCSILFFHKNYYLVLFLVSEVCLIYNVSLSYCLVLPPHKASACLANDSAVYQRTSQYGDDVVIVALSFSFLFLFFFGIV